MSQNFRIRSNRTLPPLFRDGQQWKVAVEFGVVNIYHSKVGEKLTLRKSITPQPSRAEPPDTTEEERAHNFASWLWNKRYLAGWTLSEGGN